MNKKIISVFMCGLLLMGSLVGCGGNTTIEDKADVNTEAKGEGTEQTEKSENEVKINEALAVEKTKVYVSPEWLNSVINNEQNESKDFAILECGWGKEEIAEDYKNGHVPGAMHMNTDNIESPEKWDLRSGEEMEKLMLDFGITKDTTVICYSSKGLSSADDRVAFAMLWAGVENVKVLDGGLEAWNAKEFALETTSNKGEAVESFGVTVPAHPEYILDTEQIKEKLKNDDNFKLVSIRSWAEFVGETSGYSYIDRAGEPEGAIWGHDTDDGSYADENGNTVDTDVLAKYLAESDVTLENELSFYCGTGWRAAVPFLLCYEEGMTNISMYDDGWFVYQNDGANSVQLGDPKSDEFEITTVEVLSTDKSRK